MAKKIKAESATWPIGKLKDHPRQSALFRDLPAHELDELAADIKANGFRHAVEITPDGVIIAGHQRVRALRKLGRKTVPVLIRHDLAERGEGAVEEHLIGDTLRRRQLDPLDLARCYVRLREIERKRPPGELYSWEQGDLRDRIAKRLGRSGRSFDRWLQVLQLPDPLQQAVSAGDLSQRQATRIAALPQASQQEVAAAVAGGTPVRETLARYLPRASARLREGCRCPRRQPRRAGPAAHLRRGAVAAPQRGRDLTHDSVRKSVREPSAPGRNATGAVAAAVPRRCHGA